MEIIRHAPPSTGQLERLVELLEEKPWLATGHARTAFARVRMRKAWSEIATALNTDKNGCEKTWDRWAKVPDDDEGVVVLALQYWKDKKGATKRKTSLMEAAWRRSGAGVEDVPELTETEQRIVMLMSGEKVAARELHLKRKPSQDDHTDEVVGEDSEIPDTSDPLQPTVKLEPEDDDETTEDESDSLPDELETPSSQPQPQLQIICESSATHRSTEGAQVMTPPRRKVLPPHRNVLPPHRNVLPPHRNVLPSHRNTLPPRRNVLPSNRWSTPPRRRLRHESPPRRSEMSIDMSLSDRIIGIEERRVEVELTNARANESMARAVTQLAGSFDSYARSINNLLDRLADRF